MSENNEQLEIAKQLQDYLDENKEKLSDEIYKNISEMNLKQFNIQTHNFYKVTYISYKARKYDQFQVGINPDKKTTIIKIPDETYVQLKEHLDGGKTCIDCLLKFDIVKKQLFIEDNYISFEGQEKCEDDDCD